MDYIISVLNTYLDNEDLTKWVVLGFVFLSAVALTVSIGILINNLSNPLKQRLNTISAPNKNRHTSSGTKQIDKTLESIEKYVTPKSKAEQLNTKELLMHAGFEKSSALTSFYAIKIILSLFALIGAVIATNFFPELTSQKVVIYTLIAVGSASFIPNIILRNLAENRTKALRNAFPDALDLLVVASEAGLGFQAALNRVAKEIDSVSPELSQELQLVGQKARIGISIPVALNQFVERTGLIELQGLISIITQSVKLGSSMGDTLREYADEFRDRRMQKAEEEAAKIGTKMIFPLVTCIWPGFFAVAVGPAIVKVLDMFAGR
ncbi:type II secretion system F family protein (plasmid) [Photobacterium sp. DA100]|uniref:type II secretion system F family protein n=1 Tax=Photobacterium sp. DA100 TaxID=3027472 RepID=UPI00247A69EB|nr:type II secretion system F family protein [Photobacterium sp. DA100]WEM45618.1 type II secretion system F family protein [Photobacterium sp. DA100]